MTKINTYLLFEPGDLPKSYTYMRRYGGDRRLSKTKENIQSSTTVPKNKEEKTYTIFNVDEWKLKSIKRRSMVLNDVEKAFDDASAKIAQKSSQIFSEKEKQQIDEEEQKIQKRLQDLVESNKCWRESLHLIDNTILHEVDAMKHRYENVWDKLIPSHPPKNIVPRVKKEPSIPMKKETKLNEKEDDKPIRPNRISIAKMLDGLNVEKDEGNCSRFEDDLFTFGRHYELIKNPKIPIKEMEDESYVATTIHWHSSMKHKYDEDVVFTKKEVWTPPTINGLLNNKKSSSTLDNMSFLDNFNGEIITGSNYLQLQQWVNYNKNTKYEACMEGLKGTHINPIAIDAKPFGPDSRIFLQDSSYQGDLDEDEKPHGSGTITFINGDIFMGNFQNGKRYGKGRLIIKNKSSNPDEISSIEGNYAHDKLDGLGRVEYISGKVMYSFFSEGVSHGLYKIFEKDGGEILETGIYTNGSKSGTIWKFLIGGATMIGTNPEMTGSDIVYLYPDLKTALIGTFVKGEMKCAQVAFVKVALKQREIYHLKYTEMKGPLYNYDPGTSDTMCQGDPFLRDPYEYGRVYVKLSKMKGASEGLHARRDVFKDEIVSFYNGIRLTTDDLANDNIDEWQKNAYKIMDLKGPDPESGKEGVIDILPEAVSMKNYRASLSHKANHNFKPNSKFTLFHHPRFGLVPAIIIIVDAVGQDEEITVSYDYAMDEAPPWYQDLYTQRIMDSYTESKNFELSLQ